VAYLEQVPAVDRVLPRADTTFVGSILVGALDLPVLSAEGWDHRAARLSSAPERAATRERGEYILQICRGCHSPDLRGGPPPHPGAPPAADISPETMAGWRFEELQAALREGKKRDGRPLDAAMPWRSFARLGDEELRALWLALRAEGT
jgi:hypothetical protein